MYQEQCKELQNLFSYPARLPSLPPGTTATQFPPTTVHRVNNSPIVSYTTQTARTQGRICLYNKLSAPHIKMHFFRKKKNKKFKKCNPFKIRTKQEYREVSYTHGLLQTSLQNRLARKYHLQRPPWKYDASQGRTSYWNKCLGIQKSPPRSFKHHWINTISLKYRCSSSDAKFYI